jgi:hypothetical protein
VHSTAITAAQMSEVGRTTVDAINLDYDSACSVRGPLKKLAHARSDGLPIQDQSGTDRSDSACAV